MGVNRLLGSKATRSMTVLSVLVEARRSMKRGNKQRAMLLLVAALLAWKWTVVGLAAQGAARAFRDGRGANRVN